jgi:hypothetical protein
MILATGAAQEYRRSMDLHEFDIQKSSEPPAEPPRRYPWMWVAAGIVVVLVVAGYLMMSRREQPAEDRVAVTDVSPTEPAEKPAPTRLGGEGDPIDLPPLEESDPLVRQLVRKLSSHPTVLAWLATDNLLRRFTAGLQNIAAGRSPAAHAQQLAPTAAFAPTERGRGVVMDGKSYRRYNAFADAVGSIDPKGAAKLYATLRPRLDQAHTELGTPSGLDATVERAIYVLLQTPVIEEPIPLQSKGVNYVYADARLEQLTPAQKHLLRMGPRNMRLIQTKLREIAGALGIPGERLPEH